MSDKSSSSSSGIGTLDLLGVVFITLKLIGIIDWSWWWVTCPFWGGIVLVVLGLIIYVIYEVVNTRKRRKMRSQPTEKRKSNFQQRLDEMAEKKRNNKTEG